MKLVSTDKHMNGSVSIVTIRFHPDLNIKHINAYNGRKSS